MTASPHDGPHMSLDEFRQRGHQMIDWIADHLENLESLPFGPSVEPGQVRSLIPNTAPDQPESFDAIMADLGRAHPQLERHVERIDVCRWGHGMIQPRPGFVWGAARRAAATPIGPIHFAHSDLSGIALFEEAFHHGVRAADEVRAALSGVPT